MAGDHRAWMILDAASQEEARSIVPPVFRSQARIVWLNRFSMDQIEQILSRHEG